MVPVQPARKRLKVGTFKVDNDNRHTTRGERFMKKIMDLAIAEDVEEVYVTMFPTDELQGLIRMFEKFDSYMRRTSLMRTVIRNMY